MKVLARLLPALLVTAAPLAAGAQQACEPDQGSPQFVARAYLSLTRAIAAINQDGDPRNDLRETIRVLSDPRARDRDRNVVGQQYTLGQTYVLLLTADVPGVVRRGEIGFQTNPEETIDLVLAADSMFKAVVAAHPECAETMAQWRQHKPWLDLVNTAITHLNSDRPDSAEFYARRAMVLYEAAPYPYTILAVVAQQRDQADQALAHFRQALQYAGTDTIYADIRAKTLGDIARLLADRAETAQPAQRVQLAREAIAAYDVFLAEPEVDDVARGFGIAQLAGLYTIAGDSARVRNVYASVLANPERYGERTLLEAGVVATRAGQMSDAARLFGAVHADNPYQRDALYNLAAAHIGSDAHERALPLIRALTGMDPNNPDVYMLYAYAYSGLMNVTREAARRQAYTDSLVKYNQMAEQMPIRVAVTEFTRLRESTRVSGSVENRGNAPRTFTVQVELLGRNGQVIATEQTSVGPVSGGERATFRINFPTSGEDVAGYRYRPLT
jgi:tetratricopeptide (TPR) repeat protein